MSVSPLADQLPVPPVFLWVSAPPGGLPDGILGRELLVGNIQTITVAVLHHAAGSIQWAVQARHAADDAALRVLVSGGGVICLVSGLETVPGGGTWLQLQAYPFAAEHHWDIPHMVVGVDDAMLRSLRGIGGAHRNPEDLLRWLKGKLLLPPRPARPGAQDDQPHRVVAAATPGQELEEPEPCELYGGGLAAALAISEGAWRLNRVRRKQSPPEGRRFMLIHVSVDFADESVSRQLRAEMTEERRRLADQEAERSFVALWNRYQLLENQHALRRLKDLQFLIYRRWRRLEASEDVLRFELDDADPETDPKQQRRVLERLAAARRNGEEVELECSRDLPRVLGGAGTAGDDQMGVLDLQLSRGNEVGSVVAVNIAESTVDLKMRQHRRPVHGVGPEQGDRLPHSAGFLHAAVGGDYRRLQRRQKALDRLLRRAIPLPQLLPLLQGRLARGPVRGREITAWSEAARKAFGDYEPTPAQTLALHAALNTPDIAVIQGPPGTGKTEVIAALQTRLVEEGRSTATVSRQMLLTSSQHEAVDNLVERCKVWDGIPAMKIDSQQRISMDEIDRWVEQTRTVLRTDIQNMPVGRRTQALREVARQAASYCAQPMPAEELPPWLNLIRERVKGIVTGALLARLDEIKFDMARRRASVEQRTSPRQDALLRTIRGIRVTPVAFTDDGPARAASVLAALRRIPETAEGHTAILERAAAWAGDEVPPFLPELDTVRGELIDRFAPPVPRYDTSEPREDVLSILDEIIAELSVSQRDSDEGVVLALQEFLEDLEGDPEGVYSTLRLYTPALASTCQQADSRGMQEAKDGELLFDTVIVDEAAQANPLDLLIPLTMASRVVLIGDHHQLPQMLEPDVEKELREDDPQALDLLRKSLFGQLFALLSSDPAEPPRAVRLDTQYRMHKVLGDFVARNFYQDDLKSVVPDDRFTHNLQEFGDRPAAWIQVGSEFGTEVSGRSKARPAEARIIAAVLKRYALDRPDLTFGVISFYRDQVDELKKELLSAGLLERDRDDYLPVPELRRNDNGENVTRLQVGTVDSFQGRQFDVVFLSVTRSTPVPGYIRGLAATPAGRSGRRYSQWAGQTYGHLGLSNRLCVAMSRQKRLLAVVGDDALFDPAVAPASVSPLCDFREMCRRRGHGVLLTPTPGRALHPVARGQGG